MSVLQRQWGLSRVFPTVRDTHLLGVIFATHGVADGLLTGLYIWASTGNVFEANPLAAHATNWFFWNVGLEYQLLVGEPWLWTGLFFLGLKIAIVGGVCLLLYRHIESVRLTRVRHRAVLAVLALVGILVVVNNLVAVV